MPQIVLTRRAWNDLSRLRDFLQGKNPQAAAKAVQRITSAIDQLEVFPYIGREVEELPEGFRELVVSFGNDGYVVLYEASSEQVIITAIRHQREAGF